MSNPYLLPLFGILFAATAVSADPAAKKSEGPDAAKLYAERCAECHTRAAFSPSLEALSNLTAEEAHKELWWGVMQQFTNGLDDHERWELAKFVTSHKPDSEKDPRGHGVTMCKDKTPLVPDAKHDWPGLSKDNRFHRHATNTKFTAAGVKNLKLKWAVAFPQVHSFNGGGHAVSVVGDRVFVGNLNHWVYSFDAGSGCAHWAFQAEWRIRSNVAVRDGIAVFGDTGANVYGVNAETGQLLWRDKADWTPTARVSGNVTVHDGVAYVPISNLQEVLNMGGRTLEFPCCTARGAIVAYDLRTGERKWRTYTIDQEPGYIGTTKNGTNRYGPSGVVVFSAVTVDDKRGLLYVPTGNQMTEPVVPESDSVIALDMKTGAKRWVTSLAPEQMGGQDVYHLGCEAWVDEERKTCSPINPKGEGDRDIVSPVVLVKRSDGKEVLMAGSKDGMLYALDPDASGKILWQTRVGRGGEVGGIQWGFASDGKNAYVPVTDMDADMKGDGSFTAVDLVTGQSVWRVEKITPVCEGKPTPPCSNAFGLPSTVASDVVFTGAADGVLRAYDTANGKLVWTFDTVRDFETVNGHKGYGGSLGFGGPVIVKNRLFVSSGLDYANFGMAGNVLLAFELDE